MSDKMDGFEEFVIGNVEPKSDVLTEEMFWELVEKMRKPNPVLRAQKARVERQVYEWAKAVADGRRAGKSSSTSDIYNGGKMEELDG